MNPKKIYAQQLRFRKDASEAGENSRARRIKPSLPHVALTAIVSALLFSFSSSIGIGIAFAASGSSSSSSSMSGFVPTGDNIPSGGGGGGGSSSSSGNSSTLITNLGLYLGNWDLNSAPTTATPSTQTVINSWLGAILNPTTIQFPASVDANNSIVPLSTSNIQPQIYQNLTTFASPTWNAWAGDQPFQAASTTYPPLYISAVAGVDQQSIDPTTGQPAYPFDLTSAAALDLNTIVPITFATSDLTDGTQVTTAPNGLTPSSSSTNSFLYSNDFAVKSTLLNAGTSTSGTNVLYGTNFNTKWTPQTIFSSATVQPNLPTMVSSSLMDVLQYSNTPFTYSSSGTQTTSPYDQESYALGFARNLTGMNLPTVLPEQATISSLLSNATSTDATTANSALTSLFSFLTNLYYVTAQQSVGVHNIAEIMIRRKTNANTGVSPAYGEYLMATRRLMPTQGSSGSPTNPWVTDLQSYNQVQLTQEMLYLLAEINYQLYLSRMQEEKILLTLSASEIQGANNLRQGLALEAPSSSSTSS